MKTLLKALMLIAPVVFVAPIQADGPRCDSERPGNLLVVARQGTIEPGFLSLGAATMFEKLSTAGIYSHYDDSQSGSLYSAKLMSMSPDVKDCQSPDFHIEAYVCPE